MKSLKQAIRSLEESAKRIKADQTVPGEAKKAFLYINGVLTAELKRRAGAPEKLRGSKDYSKDSVALLEAVIKIKEMIEEHDRRGRATGKI